MKSVPLWLLLLLLPGLVLGGCTLRPSAVAPPRPPYFKEWVPALQERSDHWQRYQARIRLKAQTSDKKFNLDIIVLANLPDQLRLEAFRMGQTVGVLTLNNGQSSLFVPSEKILYSAVRSEDLTDHLLGIALPVDSFGYSLCATLPSAQLDGFQVMPHDREWDGHTKPSPDGWSSVWHFTSQPQAITSATDRRGALEYTIRYEPPVGLAVQEVPQKIIFSSTQWQIEATVQELIAVPTTQDAAFIGSFGGGVRRVELTR
jgi:outer membrane biogenesis lipoprotein LolB